MSLYVTSTLSVSRKEQLDCEELAEYLGKAGIITSVTSNISMQPHKEYGCRLVQSISSKEDMRNIWEKISKRYGFICGHLSVSNTFGGCIRDFLEPTKCNT